VIAPAILDEFLRWLRWDIVGGKRPATVRRRIPQEWQREKVRFVRWGRWYLDGRKGTRPAEAFTRPPRWARELLQERPIKAALGPQAAPVATTPYLASHRGALLRQPGGAGWDFAKIRAAGFEWVALNVGDHTAAEWEPIRQRALFATEAGLKVVPWSRLGHPDKGESKADCLRRLRALLDIAKSWATNAPIVNVETEIKPPHPDITPPDGRALGGLITPSDVARELERYGMAEAAISTEAVVYDMHWVPLAAYPVLLQILPRDNGWNPAGIRSEQAKCVKRAHDYGFAHVGVSVQTYEMADGSHPDPAWFDLNAAGTSLIWGDNVAPNEWGRWAGFVASEPKGA
jgi:hypothetical protein